MRHLTPAFALMLLSLSANPAFALRSGPAPQALPPAPLPERHARGPVSGPTMWFLLVDMASHCTKAHPLAHRQGCFEASTGKPGLKLQ